MCYYYLYIDYNQTIITKIKTFMFVQTSQCTCYPLYKKTDTDILKGFHLRDSTKKKKKKNHT